MRYGITGGRREVITIDWERQRFAAENGACTLLGVGEEVEIEVCVEDEDATGVDEWSAITRDERVTGRA